MWKVMFVYYVCVSVKLMFSIFFDFVYVDGIGISIWSNLLNSVKIFKLNCYKLFRKFWIFFFFNICYCKERYFFYYVNFEGYFI